MFTTMISTIQIDTVFKLDIFVPYLPYVMQIFVLTSTVRDAIHFYYYSCKEQL